MLYGQLAIQHKAAVAFSGLRDTKPEYGDNHSARISLRRIFSGFAFTLERAAKFIGFEALKLDIADAGPHVISNHDASGFRHDHYGWPAN